MPELKTRGVRAFIWDFLGKASTQLAGFLITVLLARLLSPSDFGLIAMVMVFIGMANVFSDVGLGSALIQREEVQTVHYSSVFYFNITAGLLLTTLTYFSAEWISQFYQQDTLVSLVQVLSISFVISAFGSTQTTKLSRELNYSVIARANFFSSLSGGLVGVGMALSGAGVWSLVTQTLLTGVTYNLLIWKMSRWRPGLEFSVKPLLELWKFGSRIFLIGLLNAVAVRLDYIFIGKMFTPATLAFFQRAKSMNLLVTNYSSASLSRVMFPILSSVQADLSRFTRIAMTTLNGICFVTFLLVGGLYVVSGEIIIILFGDKWEPSVEIIQILVLSGFSYPVSSLLLNILRGRGNSKALLRLEIYRKMVVFLNLTVLYFCGIQVYLYGLIVVAVFGVSLNIFYASEEIDVPCFVFAKPVLCQGALAILAALLVKFLFTEIGQEMIVDFFVKGSAFLIFYCALSLLFKTEPYRVVRYQMSVLFKGKLGRN